VVVASNLGVARPEVSRLRDAQGRERSLLFQWNVHPKLVQGLLGHASVAINLDTYSHMLPGMGSEAADAMGETLG